MTTVLVTGDRYWKDKAMIVFALSQFSAPVRVVHGGARGADTLAGQAAHELGFAVYIVEARWDDCFCGHEKAVHDPSVDGGTVCVPRCECNRFVRQGRAAGPIRNQRMLDKYHPDVALAFHDDLWGKSKGTRDMVTRIKKAKIKWQHFSHA